MKNLILTLLCFFILQTLTAQEGMVVYNETIQLNFTLPPEMKGMNLPKSQSSERALYIKDGKTLYKHFESVESGDNDVEMEGEGGVRIRMNTQRSNDVTFHNLSDGSRVAQKDLMGKLFLVSGGSAPKWKVAKERREILGYLCQKATTVQDDSIDVIAWFTPQIPVSGGPGDFTGLPGLVLEVDIDEGNRVLSAASVKMDEKITEEMEKPSKGKKVSQEKFEEIRTEKMKEMRATRGRGGTNVIIRRG